MGQKVNPISNRLGIIRGWDSNWYGGNDYGDSLLEDSKIRKYLNARLAKAKARAARPSSPSISCAGSMKRKACGSCSFLIRWKALQDDE